MSKMIWLGTVFATAMLIGGIVILDSDPGNAAAMIGIGGFMLGAVLIMAAVSDEWERD